MGVDFSRGDAHFGHGSFRLFCRSSAAMVGIRLDEMGGVADWSTVIDPIAPLLWRNDAGGELTPEEARGAAARLEELMSDEGNRDEIGGCQWEDILAGLKVAAEAGESFIIMG